MAPLTSESGILRSWPKKTSMKKALNMSKKGHFLIKNAYFLTKKYSFLLLQKTF